MFPAVQYRVMKKPVWFFHPTKTSNPTDTGLLSEYVSLITQYVEVMESMDALGEEDLNTAELAYYIEVTARIEQKLLECY